MAYEIEAITSDSTTPQIQQPVWRPERTVGFGTSQERPPKKPETPKIDQLGSDKAPLEVPPKAPESVAPELTLSPAAAALARKEQRFRQQQLELKAQQDSLEAERKEIADLKALRTKLAAKDYSDVEKLVSYDDYTNYLIEKSGQTSPELDHIKKLEAKVSELEKSQKDDVDKRFEAAVAERRRLVKDLVEKSADYSSVKEMDATEHVVQHILATWEEDQVDLSPEQAAKEVEEALVEQAKKWTALSKLKPKVEEPKAPEKKPLPTIKTITNTMAATGDVKTRPNYSAMRSEEERWKAAREKVLQDIERSKQR